MHHQQATHHRRRYQQHHHHQYQQQLLVRITINLNHYFVVFTHMLLLHTYNFQIINNIQFFIAPICPAANPVLTYLILGPNQPTGETAGSILANLNQMAGPTSQAVLANGEPASAPAVTGQYFAYCSTTSLAGTGTSSGYLVTQCAVNSFPFIIQVFDANAAGQFSTVGNTAAQYGQEPQNAGISIPAGENYALPMNLVGQVALLCANMEIFPGDMTVSGIDVLPFTPGY